MKKFLAVILATIMMFGVMGCAVADDDTVACVIDTVESSQELGEILVENGPTVLGLMWAIAHIKLEDGIIDCYAVSLDTTMNCTSKYIVYTYDSDGCGYSNGYLSFYIPTSSRIMARSLISSFMDINEEGNFGLTFINGND